MIFVAGWDVEQDRHRVEALAWQASIGDATQPPVTRSPSAKRLATAMALAYPDGQRRALTAGLGRFDRARAATFSAS
jgi:hypothetical protein